MSGRNNRGLRRTVLILAAAGLGAFLWSRRGGQRLEETEVEPPPPAARRVSVTRPAAAPRPQGAISGWVVDPEGRGIEDATVTAVRQRSLAEKTRAAGSRLTFSIRTKLGGSYRFDRIEPGFYVLVANAAGFTTAASGTLELEPGAALEGVQLRLWAGGVSLSGRVLDAGGGAIPGARVRATGHDLTGDGTHRPRSFQAEADGDGQYRLQLPKGRHKVYVEADGYAGVTESMDLQSVRARDFLLQPAARIAGRVVTADGRQPIEGARDWAHHEKRPRDFSVEPVTTDERGAFRIEPLPPGTFRLTARKEALVGALPQPVSVDATDVVDDVEIVLSRGLMLEGTVTSTSRRPVPHARLSLKPRVPETGMFAPSAGPFADETGRYLLGGILPGDYFFHAFANGYAPHMEPLSITAPMKHDVVLTDAAVVTGVVLTAAGQPAARAMAEAIVLPSGQGAVGASNKSVADGQGRFTVLGLGAGRLVVSARQGTEAGQVGPMTLEPGGRREVTIHLATGARVSGVVSWEDGSPVAGASVMTVANRGRSIRMEAWTSWDGSFTIPGLPAGPVSLQAVPPAEGFQGPRLEGLHETTLTLEQGEHKTGVKLTIVRH